MSPTSSLFNGDFATWNENSSLIPNPLACPECQCQLTTQYTSTPLRYTVIYGDSEPSGDYPAIGEMMGCMKCRLQWYNLSMPSHDTKLETPDDGATYIVKAIGLPRYKWVSAWAKIDDPTNITFLTPRPKEEKAIVAYDGSKKKSIFSRILTFFGRIFTWCKFW
jgi:hypothetical protein